MGSEEVIKRILAKRPDIARSVLESMIVKKKEASGDLLSFEGAAHLVAQDFLVETSVTRKDGLKISDMVPQLGDATLIARVVAAWPKQRFKRKDETEGTFIRLLLGDKTGTLTCLVWNSNTIQTLESSDIEGKMVRVAHGYTREGLSDRVELHVGDRGDVTLLTETAEAESHPPVEAFIKSVDQLSDQDQISSLQGTVVAMPVISSFEKDGIAGTVIRMLIEDSTGSATVVAWNEKADELKTVRVGDTARVMNGRVRRSADGQFELHLDKRSLVRLLGTPRKLPSSKPSVSIAEIKPTNRLVNVVGRVLSTASAREIQTKSGEKLRVSSILIGDKTGLVPVTLWRGKAELADRLKEDTVVFIENAQTRERYDEVGLDVGESGNAIFDSDLLNMSGPGQPPITQIGQLKKNKAPIIVEGVIVEEAVLKEVELKNGSKTQLATFRIRDASETVRVTFWRDLAKVAKPLKKGDRVRIIGVRTKEGFSDKWELHSSSLTSLKLIGKEPVGTPSADNSNSVLLE